MGRLLPYQPDAGVSIVSFSPSCVYACEPGHDPHELPIADERLTRDVGVSHANNRQREYS